MNTVTVVPVPVPTRLDDPEIALLAGCVEVSRRTASETYGSEDVAWTLREMHADLLDQHAMAKAAFAAVRPAAQSHGERVGTPTDRRVVGDLFLSWYVTGDTKYVHAEMSVLPEYRRHGIGTALFETALRTCRELGRKAVAFWAGHGSEPSSDSPYALVPPTGSGLIDRRSSGAGFALALGLRLGQAERHSLLMLPVDEERVDGLLGAALNRAGHEYRLHQWLDRCPDTWLESFAALETRMSTDIPHGGLDVLEVRWDAERVRMSEQTRERSGRRSVVSAVEHVPTGTLAGFTMLECPEHSPEVVFQEDTLVLPEHRGHRLGMVIKAANLRLLAQEFPQARRIHTWNAEENDHMLAINVALGFRPHSVQGQWIADAR